MSLTLVVKARSVGRVSTRRSMSSGEMPVNDQTTLTTGMSMSGKMSVGMRDIETTPRTTMSIGHHDERVGPAQREPDDPHSTLRLHSD